MGWKPAYNQKRSDDQGPPDIEDLFKKMFSGKKSGNKKSSNKFSSGNSNKTGDTENPEGRFWFTILIVIAVIIIIWALSGIFTVQQYEQGVILRFGKYNRTVRPGVHWMARLFETKYVLNIQQQNNFPWPLQPMLTEPTQNKKSGSKQSQLVDVAFNIQWKINNLKDFLFNVDNPQASLKESIDSAIRQVIGQTSFNQIISTSRSDVQSKVQDELVSLMKRYKTGIEIMSVNMQKAIPPQPVKEAFQDLVNAPQDQETTINKSEIYKSNLIPVADGQAQRIVIEAQAKKENLILTAKANTAQYSAILAKYKKAPLVTSDRLYFDTLQSVFSHSHLMVVDGGGKGDNNLFYLPLMPHQGASGAPANSYKNSDLSTVTTASHSQNTAVNSNNNQTSLDQDYNRWRVAQS